jgi:hypothetical protein
MLTHVLAWHLWPSGHALPHMAQFWSSLAVDVHCCPHCVSPESAWQPHLPL